nr:unnamed protein product [Digitaria exilis]
MDLRDIRDLVASLFIMLNQKMFILFRVEFLVAVVTVLFLAMFVMDVFRRHFHNTVMKAIFSLFDAVSDTILIYLMGAMQAAPFMNELFPVWALVLVIFRQSVGFIYGYGVLDPRGRRFTELAQLWLGCSSELISEHMRDPSKWRPEDCNPVTMEGYRYLVFGERSSEIQKPQHDPSSLEADNNIHETAEQKDLSLAFALSRLLRCRFEDVKLQENIRCRINRKLVKLRIVEEDPKRAFGIMESQLAFVNDYFNTRYPMVFWSGLHTLVLSLLQSVVTVGFVIWLSVDIRRVYRPPRGELVHLVKGVNVDMIITWAFMFLVMFKEIWEMVTYFLSDWTRLLLMCRYASRENDELGRDICMERLILSLFRFKINAKMWHGHLDQYIFLQSYKDRPKFWNLIHYVTTGLIAKRDDGAKLGRAIDVPQCVQPAILEKLSALLDVLAKPGSQDHSEPPTDPHGYSEKPVNTDGSRLPKLLTTLLCGDRFKRYGWACFDLPTSSHIILVWHIATNLCEMALAKEQGVDLGKPGILRSFMSYKPYLINVDELKESNPGFMCSLLSRFTGCLSKSHGKLTEELRKRYIVANSLSQYCAYLLVKKPDLIPDSFLVPKMVFQETVKSSRDETLIHCDSLEAMYNKLYLEAYRASENSNNVKEGQDVVKQGALLGKLLLDHEEKEDCWEILAGVWSELLVHIAPTWNAEEHITCLESGGEFITNIWALLWHCGIEKSNLWPEYDAPDDDAPAKSQGNSAGNNNFVNPGEKTQQSTADVTNHLTRTEVHGADDIQGTRKPEAISLRIPPGGIMEGQRSCEIEEAF